MKNEWLSRRTSLEVTDYYQLLALHRAIMEAKFGHGDPSDRDILASPLLAAVAVQVVEALSAAEEQKKPGVGAGRWQSWWQLDPSRREWALIEQRLQECPKWREWSRPEREKYLDALASPFVITGDHRERLLQSNPEPQEV